VPYTNFISFFSRNITNLLLPYYSKFAIINCVFGGILTMFDVIFYSDSRGKSNKRNETLQIILKGMVNDDYEMEGFQGDFGINARGRRNYQS